MTGWLGSRVVIATRNRCAAAALAASGVVRPLVVSIVLLGLTAALGCGGNGGDPDHRSALADRLPGEPSSLAVVDLVAAKRALGLPEDADPKPGRSRYGSPRYRLAALVAFTHSNWALRMRGIDASRVTGVAGSEGPHGVVILATDQRYDAIAGALGAISYRRHGGVMVGPKKRPYGYYPAVGGRRGMVAFGLTPAAVRDALDSRIDAGPAADLIGEVQGALRWARTQSGNCIQEMAVADRIEPAQGEFMIRVEGEADASDLGPVSGASLGDDDTGDGGGAFRFYDRRAEGDVARAKFTYSSRRAVSTRYMPSPLYEC